MMGTAVYWDKNRSNIHADTGTGAGTGTITMLYLNLLLNKSEPKLNDVRTYNTKDQMLKDETEAKIKARQLDIKNLVAQSEIWLEEEERNLLNAKKTQELPDRESSSWDNRLTRTLDLLGQSTHWELICSKNYAYIIGRPIGMVDLLGCSTY
uniref:Uncharacterized protein n=1 Tax=Romanomermis culicivorax TaxID=13658 RepID=A0A915IZ50_ROMCU